MNGHDDKIASNNEKDITESDETEIDENKEVSNKTPEPTFTNEPRYDPPDTPKKTPQKTEPNPMLKLAVPRSARSRKISFKEEEKNKIESLKDTGESELSDDEAEQDEILSLDVESKTFSQEINETRAVVTCKAAPPPVISSYKTPATTSSPVSKMINSNTCTELVPLVPKLSKSSVSSTDLVPVETVEIKPLSLSKYPPAWSSNVLTPASRISVTSSHTTQTNNYNFSGMDLFPEFS